MSNRGFTPESGAAEGRSMREYWDEWMALSEEEREQLTQFQDSLPPYHSKPMGQLLDERRESGV